MRRLLLSLLILPIINYVTIYAQYDGKNEACISISGNSGTCKILEECPTAIASLKNGGKPTICSFIGKVPIVCCDTVLRKPRISIAEQKCSEYRTTSIPTTTPKSKWSSKKSGGGFGIGGVNARPFEFPHMAILGAGGSDDIRWLCGGTLISENFVLTAAHCTRSQYGRVAQVKLAVHKIGWYKSSVQTFTVRNIYPHPNYTFSQNYHDIALLELDRAANIQGGVRPACLHTSGEFIGDWLIATGWGATELYGNNSEIMQKVNLTYVSYTNCARFYRVQNRLDNGLDDNTQFCADGGGRRADTCQGDSGGPLQLPLNGDSLYTVVGITSFGIKCAVIPAVYTRVSHYVPWIESIVWPI